MGELAERYDVLIIGAGLSGIGMAAQMTQKAKGKSFAVLESRTRMGGTWDLFKYPGIRSDSDMYTFGYAFRPWMDRRAIAPADAILGYLQGTIDDYKLAPHIHFGIRVLRASWSSEDAEWTLILQDGDTGETREVRAGFVVSATGYYNYEQGYTPDIPGLKSFAGDVLHPQFWPEEFDYTGKRVVVIGSGATAVTLVPSMAAKAAHVTMLQRSPTYVLSRPASDKFTRVLRAILPAKLGYKVIRLFNAYSGLYLYGKSRKYPNGVRKWLRKQMESHLKDQSQIDAHFSPSYDPWDQRLCLVPDADLFEVLNDGSASIVTDHIAQVEPNGIALQSGGEIEADVIVTATGLDLLFLGGIDVEVDGQAMDAGHSLVYRGMMLEGVPNMAAIFGYTNASWTLKADLTSDYVCRLLVHMDKVGAKTAVPVTDPDSRPAERPLVELKSGYIDRALDRMPKQGDRMPWKNHENWFRDYRAIRWGGFDDDTLRLK